MERANIKNHWDMKQQGLNITSIILLPKNAHRDFHHKETLHKWKLRDVKLNIFFSTLQIWKGLKDRLKKCHRWEGTKVITVTCNMWPGLDSEPEIGHFLHNWQHLKKVCWLVNSIISILISWFDSCSVVT